MEENSLRSRAFGGMIVCGLCITIGVPVACYLGYFTWWSALLFSLAVCITFIGLCFLFALEAPDVPEEPGEHEEVDAYQKANKNKKGGSQ